ncbi:MAG: LicD family protein [Salinivirgaceae bacterium]|nr:LicD family protein [Salinivirgaceae bacterium]MBO7595217.1 LicD family protein [Salinivirgaceae bacterium]
MADYDIRPLQLKILEILQAVDKTCKEHNLRYYLTAGTMLGAIRHKGFIPWDDDADIAMPRPDYDFLMQNYKQLMPDRFEARCMENTDNFSAPFAKIYDKSTTLKESKYMETLGGVYIDVFPLDGVPNNKIAQWWHFFRYEYYKRLNYFVYRDPYKHGHGPACWLPLLAQKLYSKEWMKKKLCKLMTAYDYEKCIYVVDHDDGWKGVLKKEILGNPIPISFEENSFWGVEQYDKYLSQKYGDYMTIPPHDKQHQHNFYYLNLNKPFSEFDESDVDNSL